MLEDSPPLGLQIHIDLVLQKHVEIPLGASKAFGHHDLSAALLHVSQELLVVGVKRIQFFWGRDRGMGVQSLEVA